MKRRFPKPNIFSSRCLGFAKCRWNGETVQDGFVEKLKPFVNFVTVCPEAEIGLGVPRRPIRIVCRKGSCRLIQPDTGKDVTSAMNGFVSDYLGSLKKIDGFILKDRSPSCGIKNVNVYRGLRSSASAKKTSGFFGAGVLRHFPGAAIETEARLRDLNVQERFIAGIFASAMGRRYVKSREEQKNSMI